MRAFKFICRKCSRSQTNRPGFTYCVMCDRDYRNIEAVRALIDQARPQHQDTVTPLLFAKLWLSICQREHTDTPAIVEAAKNLVKTFQSREQLKLFDAEHD